MFKKWLLALTLITVLFLIFGVISNPKPAFGYYWMTMGIAFISYLYFFMVTTSYEKKSVQNIGGNFAAIAVKFILSATVIIFYVIFAPKTSGTDFVYFFIAYGVFFIVSYTFSYKYIK